MRKLNCSEIDKLMHYYDADYTYNKMAKIFGVNPTELRYYLEKIEKPYNFRKIIKKRKIESLIHFTSKFNEKSIDEYGILSIEKLKRRNIEFESNDELRLENKLNGVSLSITKRNEFLFEKFKKDKINNRWIEYSIDPKVLIDKECRFYFTNAASGVFYKSRGDINLYEDVSDFENMFADVIEKTRVIQNRVNKYDNETTCIQAEIIVLGDIEVKYIKNKKLI